MSKITNNTFLCRAKLPVGGKWMYGCIVYRPKDAFAYMLENTSTKSWMHVVNFQSICRYSGMEDMHGVKIFENDIHEFNGKHYIVRFGKYNFISTYGLDSAYGWYMEDCEDSSKQYGFGGNESDYVNIVGNIFDNPELLEVKNNGCSFEESST